jgi:hypothetical protein
MRIQALLPRLRLQLQILGVPRFFESVLIRAHWRRPKEINSPTDGIWM